MKNLMVYVVIGLGIVGYNFATQADRDDSGAIVDEGRVDAFSLRMGDCFDNTRSLAGDGAGEVSSLPGVPCSQPHDNEVYAVFNVDYDSFPGDDQMGEMAFDACMQRFEGFVGIDYDSSSLDIATLYPSKDSWSMQKDREVVCALYDMNGNKVTGSAKDTAI